MRIPGFTAEATLNRNDNGYYMVSAFDVLTGSLSVLPQRDYSAKPKGIFFRNGKWSTEKTGGRADEQAGKRENPEGMT